MVAAFNAEMFGPACEVAARLREGGATVDMLQESSKKVSGGREGRGGIKRRHGREEVMVSTAQYFIVV